MNLVTMFKGIIAAAGLKPAARLAARLQRACTAGAIAVAWMRFAHCTLQTCHRLLAGCKPARALVLTLLLCFVALSASAQKFTILGFDVVDKITNRVPSLVQTSIYTLPDTVRMDVSGGSGGTVTNYEFRSTQFVPGGEYLIKIDNPILSKYNAQIRAILEKQPIYEPQWVKVKLPDPLPEFVELPKVYLSRPKPKKTINLNEVEVRASRVLFYHNGDTLVYNADAFVLAEGTMLDGLISQLPGVKITSKGEIYCNGRYIDNLLLNGKDLFNGDKKLMLDNLEAYTVKDIAVYDQESRDSKLLGSNAGDNKHVMDVRLKRQYLNGWIANAEAGAGTRKRYLGRLFGMWYSDNASISGYANVNNLNDRTQPGREDTSWTPENIQNQGVADNIKSGLIYTVSGPERKWEFQGSVKYERENKEQDTETSQQNYYDSGDTYTYGWNNRHNRDWFIATDHLLSFTIAKKVNLIVKPELKYEVTKARDNNVSASTFTSINDITRQRVLDIYTSAEDTIIDHLINRNTYESLTDNERFNASITVHGFAPLVRTPIRRQILRFSLWADYTRRDNSRFNRYAINYRFNPNPINQSYQYFNGSPDNDKRYHLTLTYQKYFEGSTHLDIEYKFAGAHERRTSLLYLLDQINGFDGMDSPLGVLPSMYEYAPAIDADQSYESTLREFENQITPKLQHILSPGKNSNLTIAVGVPVNVVSRKYDYIMPALGKSYVISPTNVFAGFNTMMSLGYTPEGRWQTRTTLNADLRPRKTNLYDLMEIENTTDPLNIYTGNPDLRNAYDFKASLHSSFWKRGLPVTQSAQLTYAQQFDQLARGILYNPETGVRTIKPYNINGNWRLEGNYSLFVPFGKYRKFDISSNTYGIVRNSVDYVGSGTSGEITAMPPKRRVRTYTVQEVLKANWQNGQHRITLHADNRLNRNTGSDAGFTPFTSWNGNFGTYFLFNLPKGWSASTDLSLYIRRGYLDPRLNTTEVIWNARISKSFLKGKLLVAADGYDLLRQFKNVTYTINSQARTEVISNTIPAYFLLHIQYRFNKQPKK